MPYTSALDDAQQAARDFFNGDELRTRTFLDKYALRDIEGNLLESRPDQMWDRVAREIASVEEDPDYWHDRFYHLLEDFKFVPGGRILFGAGSPQKATCVNCYFTQLESDSLEAIFDWCKSAARTYSYGGGNGVCIGELRPANSPVNNSARYSSGAVSFMDLFSQTTGIIGQNGRRGALLISCPVDHPDVREFVQAKASDVRNVRYANVSVKLTDEFMDAVANDDDFTLRFTNDQVDVTETVRASDLWDEIVRAAHASAEPGLVFWDQIKNESPSEYCAPVSGLNPCAEQPLEHNGACCLGHVNLSKFVEHPFTSDAHIDWGGLNKAINLGTRFLDNVVEYNLDRHAHEEQRRQAEQTRRIGLGVTGLGDMLAQLGIKYDSQEAIEQVNQLMDNFKFIAYQTSTELADEKGPFPLFDSDRHLERPFIQRLNYYTKERIRESGLRNVALLTVAPVGSGSVLANTTSGVEPIFQLRYHRRSESLSQEWYEVEHALAQEYRDTTGNHDGPLPETFVTSHEIDPFFRVKMQATIQQHIDSAISSTINLDRDVDVETVKEIYQYAHQLGCKGITVYREGSREGILITEQERASQLDTESNPATPIERPRSLSGETYRIKTEMGNLYVTVNGTDEAPLEVFANIAKSGSSSRAFTEAIARLISLALRCNVKPEEIVDELTLIRGTRPVVQQEDGRAVVSVPDGIAKAIEDYLATHHNQKLGMPEGQTGEMCSSCGGVVVNTNGCRICFGCGASQCG